jgi:hypothetical protein
MAITPSPFPLFPSQLSLAQADMLERALAAVLDSSW